MRPVASLRRLSVLLRQVRIEDATFDNAAFVARLPRLRTLYVEGESSLLDGALEKLRHPRAVVAGHSLGSAFANYAASYDARGREGKRCGGAPAAAPTRRRRRWTR